jgi:hypothetical protein
MNDPVESPSHYTGGDIECIDAIRSALGKEGFIAWCHGNAMKYLWRFKHKGKPLEDLAKAERFLGLMKAELPPQAVTESPEVLQERNEHLIKQNEELMRRVQEKTNGSPKPMSMVSANPHIGG